MSRWKRGSLLSPIKDGENSRREINIIKIAAAAPDDIEASPMTRIVNALDKSTLSNGDTPKCFCSESDVADDVIDELPQKLDFPDPPASSIVNNQINQTLLKNAFKITNTTPRSTVRQRPIVSRRLLGMASRRLISPDTVLPPSRNKENGFVLSKPINLKESPQKFSIFRPTKPRCPLEDCDPNSQDNGYGISFPNKDDGKCQDSFRFAEPLGVAPRRSSTDSRSPLRSPIKSPVKSNKPLHFGSLSSGSESMDDGFTELVDMDTLDDDSQIPSDLSSLLSGQIVSEVPMDCDSTTPVSHMKSSFRRSLSLQNENVTPQSSRVRSCLFRSPNALSSASRLLYNDSPRLSPMPASPSPKSFKRPEPPTDASPALVKRCRKSTSLQDVCEQASPKKPALQRCFSETEAHAHIKSAIHRSTTDADLTGDFSKQCLLPLAEGQHEDLKSISSSTLAALIHGEYNDAVKSFKIIDCRYPYEFEGGHVNGALNLFNKDMIEQYLLEPLNNIPEIQPDDAKRNIIVFHCEFSWERGPNLSRFLRNIDRQKNKEYYPALHYPEVYLLHGGYKQFYEQQKELCSPQGYRPMRHPDHEADLRQFRSKSKSWQGDKSRLSNFTARANLKRLGL